MGRPGLSSHQQSGKQPPEARLCRAVLTHLLGSVAPLVTPCPTSSCAQLDGRGAGRPWPPLTPGARHLGFPSWKVAQQLPGGCHLRTVLREKKQKL